MGFSTAGIVLMVVAWGVILTVAILCLSKVLRTKRGPDGPGRE